MVPIAVDPSSAENCDIQQDNSQLKKYSPCQAILYTCKSLKQYRRYWAWFKAFFPGRNGFFEISNIGKSR